MTYAVNLNSAVPPDLMVSDVADVALERLLTIAGAGRINKSPGGDWTVPGDAPRAAVDAVNEIRRAIHGIYAAQDEVTDALVKSQDHLLALRALTRVEPHTLGAFDTFQNLLREARELTSSDVVALLDNSTLQSTDVSGAESEAFAELMGEAAQEVDDPEPRLVRGGQAVVAPLQEQSHGVSVLVFLRADGPVYSTGDLRLIKAVVAAANTRFTLARLHLLEIKRATFEREHEVASSLAQAVFSQPVPVLTGVEVFSETVPASLAGGDFFAFAVVDGVFWFTVGDVAGKGLPAAMVMTRAVSAARVAFLTHSADDAAGAMSAMNAELYDYLDNVGLFITVVLGSYRPKTGVLHLCNAGHSPVMLVRDSPIMTIPASLPPLGVLPHPTGVTVRLDLALGDTLILGSDGLAEQEDPRGMMLGYNRLSEMCAESVGESAAELGRYILNAVTTHGDGAPVSDDRTLVILRAVEVDR